MTTTIEAAVKAEDTTGAWELGTCATCGRESWVHVVHVDAVCDECCEALQAERAAGAANRCYGWRDEELLAEARAIPSPEVKWAEIEAVATEWGFYGAADSSEALEWGVYTARHFTAGDASMVVAHHFGLRETYSEREVCAALYLRCE